MQYLRIDNRHDTRGTDSHQTRRTRRDTRYGGLYPFGYSGGTQLLLPFHALSYICSASTHALWPVVACVITQLLPRFMHYHRALVSCSFMHCLLLPFHVFSCIVIGYERHVHARAQGCNDLPTKAAAAPEARYHQTARDLVLAQWCVPCRKGRQTRCIH